jgi:hypothetical protein
MARDVVVIDVAAGELEGLAIFRAIAWLVHRMHASRDATRTHSNGVPPQTFSRLAALPVEFGYYRRSGLPTHVLVLTGMT